ncbi:MAG: hypothetical protein Q7R75_00665 [bacterium]|nr:hypothetical protein [bacterium]
MKTFHKLLLFTFILSAILTGLEFSARKMYPRSDLYEQLHNFNKNKADTEVIVLGISHAAYGINPEIFEQKTYNLAYPTQDIFYAYELLKNNLRQLKNLKTVILFVEPFSFGYDVEKNSRHLVVDYSKNGYGPRNGMTINIALQELSQFMNHRTNFLPDFYNFLSGKKLQDDKTDQLMFNGFRRTEKIIFEEDAVIAGKKRALRHTTLPFFDKNIEDENYRFLDAFVDLAVNNSIKVILVTPPYSREYYSNFTNDFLTNFTNRLNTLLAKYQGNIGYKSYAQDKDFSHKYFHDIDHLNYEGANLLSQKIKIDFPQLK